MPDERAVRGSDLSLLVLPEFYEVVRLAPTAPIPADLFACADPNAVVSITRTADELSIIRPRGARRIDGETREEGWRALKVKGPLPFHLVGVLSHLSATLAAAGVSIFVNSTYDTDYVMVKDDTLQAAVDALKAGGSAVDGAPVPATRFLAQEPSIVEPEDAGAIVVVSLTSAGSSYHADLRLKPELCLEACGHFKQWFCFEARGMPVGGTASFSILDAGESTFSDWQGYKVAMLRGATWDRVAATTFEDGVLSWTLEGNATSSATFAYWPTYSLERTRALCLEAQATLGAERVAIGATVDGRDVECLVFGGPRTPEKRLVWVQHRQHPGEVAASWFAEGVVRRLAGHGLLERATVVVLPNLNPDGSRRGYLRVNAAGANLNRCWGALNGVAPGLGQSAPPAPETAAAIAAMRRLGGPDVMLDVHQDEEKPYVFISKTPLGVPNCDDRMRALHAKFHDVYRRRSPDFETPGPVDPVGYPEPPRGGANLNICSAAVAQAFPGCLAMTLEMPYKGNDNAGAVAKLGFTPKQAVDLGAAAVDAIADILPDLPPRRT